MKNRCWSCGLTFNDGPPPLEALSPQQAGVVGTEYGGDPGQILCQKLSGLSVYNFCSICVRFVSLPLVWAGDTHHELVHGRRLHRLDDANPRCRCSHRYEVPWPMRGQMRWVWINRAKRQHLAKVFYPQLNPVWDQLDLAVDY